MSLTKKEKQAVVKDMGERFSRAQAVVLTDFVGLKVEKMTDLRAKLTQAGLDYAVVKNTLLKLSSQGTTAEEFLSDLKGPSGVAISYDDPVAMAKILVDFAKDNDKLEIKAGLLEGKTIDVEGIKALAKLPGRPELLAMLLGAMNGVPRNLVSVLAAVPRSLMNVLNAIAEKKEAA